MNLKNLKRFKKFSKKIFLIYKFRGHKLVYIIENWCIDLSFYKVFLYVVLGEYCKLLGYKKYLFIQYEKCVVYLNLYLLYISCHLRIQCYFLLLY